MKWIEMIIIEKMHPSLCSLCKDPLSCSMSDEYSGYEGAIQCLLDGAGQVAFTTIDAVDKFFRERASAVNLIEDYQFLCLDGSRMPVTRRACEWSRRPSNTFIIRKGKGKRNKLDSLLFIWIIFCPPSFFFYPSLREEPSSRRWLVLLAHQKSCNSVASFLLLFHLVYCPPTLGLTWHHQQELLGEEIELLFNETFCTFKRFKTITTQFLAALHGVTTMKRKRRGILRVVKSTTCHVILLPLRFQNISPHQFFR